MTSDRTRAIDAALQVAAALGLAVEDAVVLHESNRLAVRLLPCDVLARVADAQSRPSAEFEVVLALQLAQALAPIGLLEPRVAPRAYGRDGFVVTLWTYYEPEPSRAFEPTAYAHALERLHSCLRRVALPVPHFTERVASAQQLVGSRELTPTLADADRAFLGGALQSLRQSIGARGPRRTAAAWRAASGQPAVDDRRPPVHRPGDLLPRAGRVRPCPRARSGGRSLPARRSASAPRLSAVDAGDGGRLALGPGRPVPERATGGAGLHRRASRSDVGRAPFGVGLVEKGRIGPGPSRSPA